MLHFSNPSVSLFAEIQIHIQNQHPNQILSVRNPDHIYYRVDVDLVDLEIRILDLCLVLNRVLDVDRERVERCDTDIEVSVVDPIVDTDGDG